MELSPDMVNKHGFMYISIPNYRKPPNISPPEYKPPSL